MVSIAAPIGEFNQMAPDFLLPDVQTGRLWHLAELRGTRGLLVMFICNHCPYVQAVLDRIVRDAHELQAHGVNTVAIMSNDPAEYPEDRPDSLRRVAEAHGFQFPYLFDESQAVAKAYGAVCTPDFFGYNAELKLQYRGRLDASGRQSLPDAPRELFDAMVTVAQTGVGPTEQWPSIGCSIKWRG